MIVNDGIIPTNHRIATRHSHNTIIVALLFTMARSDVAPTKRPSQDDGSPPIPEEEERGSGVDDPSSGRSSNSKGGRGGGGGSRVKRASNDEPPMAADAGDRPDYNNEPTPEEDEEEVTTMTKKTRRKRKRKRKAASSEGEGGGIASAANTEEVDEAAEDPATASDPVARTAFVEGIPYDATDDDIYSFFGTLQVVSLRLPRWQDSGRLRGYGHAEFATTNDLQAALKLSGKTLEGHGRYLTLQPAKPPKDASGLTSEASITTPNSNKPSKTLLLKNLSYEASEDDIRAALSPFGTLVADGGIRIARHHRNRQSKGFAYAEFESMESAQQVIQHQSENGPIVIQGRSCILDYDHGSISSSFRTETGRKWQKQYGNSSSTNTGGGKSRSGNTGGTGGGNHNHSTNHHHSHSRNPPKRHRA